MKKFTANYSFTNPNFVIQNLVENPINSEYLSVFFVVKNILQRGFPTIPSQYLQEEIGSIHKQDDFKEALLFIDTEVPIWHNTIKGDKLSNYFPAKIFFEKIIPQYFGEYAFIQPLILPEIEINELTGEYNRDFINQKVDFFLPQVKLVIEIDGQRHKNNDITRIQDGIRDNYLASKNFKTIRITTDELRNGTFEIKIGQIIKYLDENQARLLLYQKAYTKIKHNDISDYEYRTKLLPTAIIRFQILILELLINDYISPNDKTWRFNILERDIKDFSDLAIQDLFLWIENLCQLRKLDFTKPEIEVKTFNNEKDAIFQQDCINIDFSLLKRYTDENTYHSEKIYVRTDYFGAEKNYFRVSSSEPINYQITDDDKSVLEFFLQNIFEKPSFREGQFPIISNALNQKDTIGLLPTGGGKSLCYQLPYLLQPSVNFIVCPIKSLMFDQYQNLNNTLITNTNFITGDLSPEERTIIQTEFAEGKYLFVWLSPERFQIPAFRDYLATVNANFSIAYAIVDEVHCLSEWGHDFRTSYLNLAKTIEKYCPNTSFIGLTATASVNVLKDIKVEFARQRKGLDDENVKSLLDYSRKELIFEVIEDNGNKYNSLKDIIVELVNTRGFLENNSEAGLIFTPHVNGSFGCYSLSNSLNQIRKDKVRWYSGEVPMIDEYDTMGNRTGKKLPVLSAEEFKKYKRDVQASFKKDGYPLLVATKAFGMGIDKQNISYTFHYGLPSSVEALYQEAGRAGRWDKTIHNDKKAKCFILYSKETTNFNNVEKLFNKDTTFAEIKAINDDVKWNGKDVFRQIFLFLQGQKDIAEDFKIMNGLINKYFQQNTKLEIWWHDAKTTLGINEDSLQKAIYRLSLLGIVNDWTTNFTTHYEVEFLSIEDNSILKELSYYISKYDPNLNLDLELSKVNRPSVREKCIWFLLQWTFENIAYNRKQSLKTLVDWCSDFAETGNEVFKKRIDNYFRFSETTFIFQHITENPKDFEKWFEVFNKIIKIELQEELIIFIPAIEDKQERKNELERLRDSLSRFLESSRNNTGLNLVSGLIRLFLNDFEDNDGRRRFESALENIRKDFSKEIQIQIINRIVSIGHFLHEDGKAMLCLSMSQYYPQLLEKLAEVYELYYLLNDTLTQKLQQLKSINNRLHEQFTKIQ